MTPCYVEYSKAITRRYVAYREVLLDTKFEKLRAMQVKINLLISARNLNRIKNILWGVYQGPRGNRLMKRNGGRKSRVTGFGQNFF
jgi:hypothetical protein